MTEQEVALQIQILQLQSGGSGSSFPSIVAFGSHTAIPHHSPTKRTLQQSDIVLIDM
jgi:Xaa-Pro dipeptidase